MIEIRKISPQDTYEIRKVELRRNIDLSSKFTGDFENSTIHLGLFTDDKLVSILSLVKVNNNEFTGSQYQLRGMATLSNYQGKGFGKDLVSKTVEILKGNNIDIVWCNARVIALDFYIKQGFNIIGKEFDIPQIGGHYVMFKYLK